MRYENSHNIRVEDKVKHPWSSGCELPHLSREKMDIDEVLDGIKAFHADAKRPPYHAVGPISCHEEGAGEMQMLGRWATHGDLHSLLLGFETEGKGAQCCSQWLFPNENGE